MKYIDIVMKVNKQLIRAASVVKCLSNLFVIEEDKKTGLMVYKVELFDDKLKAVKNFYLNKNADYSNYNFGYYDDLIKELLISFVKAKYES